MRLFGKRFALDAPPIFVAELGCGHGGDMQRAFTLISHAKDIGADAVKLQKRYLFAYESHDEPYEAGTGGSYFDHRCRVEFDEPHEWRKLQGYAATQGIGFFASAFQPEAIEFLQDLDISPIKLPSAVVKRLCMTDRPPKLQALTDETVIASLGFCDHDDISAMLAHACDNNITLIPMACESAYPPPNAQLTLYELIDPRGDGRLAGYSCHSRDPLAAAFAVARGARLIEVHFTDEEVAEPRNADERVAYGPERFAEMKANCLKAWEMTQPHPERPLPCEQEAYDRLVLGNTGKNS